MADAKRQDPVEMNARRLLAVMVEGNIRECKNAELQSMAGIEDAYDVNDALEWLEERGAVEVKWLHDPAGPSLAYVFLKGKGKSLHHSYAEGHTTSQPSSPVFNTNIYGNVGNVAMGSHDFEQHATVQSEPVQGLDSPPQKQFVKIGTPEVEAMPENNTPRAMISYAWEDEEHKLWVREIAARLRTEGVNVTLDQWHTAPGDQLPQFMETAIRENDFILIICTPAYKEKTDQRRGGVGYEGDIMTGEAINNQNKQKFIPILRKGEWKTALPSWMGGKYTIDLRGNPYSEGQYEDLLKTLHRLRDMPPPVGQIPQRLLQRTSKPFAETVLTPEDGPITFSPDEVQFAVENWIARNKTKLGFRPEYHLSNFGDLTKSTARHYINVMRNVSYDINPSGMDICAVFMVSIVCTLDTDVVALIRSLLADGADRPASDKALVLVAEDNGSLQRTIEALSQFDLTQFSYAYVGRMTRHGEFIPVRRIPDV